MGTTRERLLQARARCYRRAELWPVERCCDGSGGIIEFGTSEMMIGEREPVPEALIRLAKGAYYGFLFLIGLVVATAAGSLVQMKWQQNLPSTQRVRQQFESHRADYVRLAAELEHDQATAISTNTGYPAFVDRDGELVDDAQETRQMPTYGAMVRATGARHVELNEAGLQRYEVAGYDSFLCSSTSVEGLLHDPDGSLPHFVDAAWPLTVVSSLECTALPHARGKVANGIYVVAIEPKWFVYRFEWQR